MTDSYTFIYYFNFKDVEIEVPEELHPDIVELIELRRLGKTARQMFDDDLISYHEWCAIEKQGVNKFRYLVEKLDIEIDSYYYRVYKDGKRIDAIHEYGINI
jgi:hypothetical protein